MSQERHEDTGAAHGPGSAQPPVTGPGNMVVFTYLDANGEEAYANGLSGAGTPPPEFRIWADLRGKGVRADDVVAVHSDLSPVDLPGAYRMKFIRETFRNARLSHSHEYGIVQPSRAAGMAALVEQADTMRRLAGGTPRPRANRAPLSPDPRSEGPMADGELARLLEETFPEVQRYDPAAMAHTLLPEPTRATLATAGLPVTVPYFFAADTPGHPPIGGLFTDAATHVSQRNTRAAGPAMETLAGHVRIGSDGGAVVTVQCTGAEDGIGRVWAADIGTGTGRYINASVTELGRCLALLTETLPRVAGKDPYAAGELIARFQDRLAGIDPSVFGDPENWWAVIVEQMWDGLL
ncbi:MAG: SUKH-4 family immunity protein [Nocardiopsaceae bacterium]|nr:SUKH-4 family immunity protein [Nocardiopsaceae bacterium]